MRIHKSYISTAMIRHDDKFCFCQIDHFRLVYGREINCGVLSDLLCEENLIWRNFGVVIIKKITRQIL